MWNAVYNKKATNNSSKSSANDYEDVYMDLDRAMSGKGKVRPVSARTTLKGDLPGHLRKAMVRSSGDQRSLGLYSPEGHIVSVSTAVRNFGRHSNVDLRCVPVDRIFRDTKARYVVGSLYPDDKTWYFSNMNSFRESMGSNANQFMFDWVVKKADDIMLERPLAQADIQNIVSSFFDVEDKEWKATVDLMLEEMIQEFSNDALMTRDDFLKEYSEFRWIPKHLYSAPRPAKAVLLGLNLFALNKMNSLSFFKFWDAAVYAWRGNCTSYLARKALKSRVCKQAIREEFSKFKRTPAAHLEFGKLLDEAREKETEAYMNEVGTAKLNAEQKLELEKRLAEAGSAALDKHISTSVLSGLSDTVIRKMQLKASAHRRLVVARLTRFARSVKFSDMNLDDNFFDGETLIGEKHRDHTGGIYSVDKPDSVVEEDEGEEVRGEGDGAAEEETGVRLSRKEKAFRRAAAKLKAGKVVGHAQSWLSTIADWFKSVWDTAVSSVARTFLFGFTYNESLAFASAIIILLWHMYRRNTEAILTSAAMLLVLLEGRYQVVSTRVNAFFQWLNTKPWSAPPPPHNRGRRQYLLHLH